MMITGVFSCWQTHFTYQHVHARHTDEHEHISYILTHHNSQVYQIYSIIYIHMYFLRAYIYIYTCICTSTYCICIHTYYIRICTYDSNYPSFSVLCQVTTDPLDAPWIVTGSRWACGHPRPCRWHASMRFVERYEEEQYFHKVQDTPSVCILMGKKGFNIMCDLNWVACWFSVTNNWATCWSENNREHENIHVKSTRHRDVNVMKQQAASFWVCLRLRPHSDSPRFCHCLPLVSVEHPAHQILDPGIVSVRSRVPFTNNCHVRDGMWILSSA